LAIWGGSLVFACKPEHNPFKMSPVSVGFVDYFIAVIVSEIREAL
jgi:hypothetical protein